MCAFQGTTVPKPPSSLRVDAPERVYAPFGVVDVQLPREHLERHLVVVVRPQRRGPTVVVVVCPAPADRPPRIGTNIGYCL